MSGSDKYHNKKEMPCRPEFFETKKKNKKEEVTRNIFCSDLREKERHKHTNSTKREFIL